MKIGILTYHRAENYGALLQAYALKSYLQSLGHDVSFVDYWPTYHQNFFKLFSLNRFRSTGWKGKIEHLINATVWFVPREKRKRRLQKFIFEKLGLEPTSKYNERTEETEHYDAVFYGSDQIWRKQNMEGVGFDDWYFGADNVMADKKIVYAGSMGTVKASASTDAYVIRMIKNFDSISVREADLGFYLKELGIPSQLVIDPVFLLSNEQWSAVAKKKKDEKYILFYNLLNNKDSVQFAERLSRETGLPIKELNKRMSITHLSRRYISTASVENFLSLIRDAEYVVSNSFHGVAFSLIFHKQFFAVGMGEKANRVVSLIKSVGVPERYISDISAPIQRMTENDFIKMEENLSELIRNSKEFIMRGVKL